ELGGPARADRERADRGRHAHPRPRGGPAVTPSPRAAAAMALVLSAPLSGAAPSSPMDVGVEEHLGRALPADLVFTDSDGRRVGDLVSDRTPTVLTLAYYRCPALCGLTLHGLAKGLAGMGDRTLGGGYRAITVSFDPRDDSHAAARAQGGILAEIGPAARKED